MKRLTSGRVQVLSAFALLVTTPAYPQSDQARKTVCASRHTAAPANRMVADPERQNQCAVQAVDRLVRRDHLTPYVVEQKVQVDRSNRIRVFFRFRQDMRKVFPKLGRFWKFPRWIGGGRYASSYGHGQPGFEVHLDPKDPSRTVGFNAHKSSDVDGHEPAGDFNSVALHVINVLQHKAGHREKAPCDLLADLPIPREAAPAIVASETKH